MLDSISYDFHPCIRSRHHSICKQRWYLLGSITFLSFDTRAFILYNREYSSQTLVYLTTALRDPILAVLADDQLDLEIEPTMIWSRYHSRHSFVLCLRLQSSIHTFVAMFV